MSTHISFPDRLIQPQSVNVSPTGWQGFNLMLCGGLRQGKLTTVGALTHCYKTGFVTKILGYAAVQDKAHFTRPASNIKPAPHYLDKCFCMPISNSSRGLLFDIGGEDTSTFL